MPENLWRDLPAPLPAELVETLASGPGVRIERIVSWGQASPPGFWYDQAEAEWVLLLQGRARLRCEGEAPVELAPGDYHLLPAHRRHRVEWTQPDAATVWLAIFFAASQET